MQAIPVPDDDLAWLSDEEQLTLIEPTDNALGEADAEAPQPDPPVVLPT
ncbi:MAG: hypothetical protein ABIS21_03205 [Acidimicrobiales bacterium]